jgi:probable HAF family extracellular repeat protein
MKKTITLCLLAVLFVSNSVLAAGFQGLGDLTGGDTYSRAFNVSADGTAVVGSSKSSSCSLAEAFLWTKEKGMVGMGNLPGGGNSIALAVTRDEAGEEWITAGCGNFFSPDGRSGEAFRTIGYTIGPNDGLGYLPGGSLFSESRGISADGSILVGQSHSGSGWNMAFRWTEDTGMVNLGNFGGSIGLSIAADISADGSVIVGFGTSGSGREAFRTTGATIGTDDGLGDLPGGSFYSIANKLSMDGSVVVGVGTSSSGREAFRWTQETGMVGLDDLPGGSFESNGCDVSADGSVVVGIGSTSLGHEAFIWDATNGMRNLRDVLIDDYGLGEELTGWTLTQANGISDNGYTIIGYGTNPDGYTEAWIATIPEPGTISLLMAGALAFLRRKRG